MCEWTKNWHPSGSLSLDLGLRRTHWWFLTLWPPLYEITKIQGQQCPYIHPVLVDRNANLTVPKPNQHSSFLLFYCEYSLGSLFFGEAYWSFLCWSVSFDLSQIVPLIAHDEWTTHGAHLWLLWVCSLCYITTPHTCATFKHTVHQNSFNLSMCVCVSLSRRV